MNFPQTLTEVQNLIDDEIQESLHLDYKEARAVGKTSNQKFDFAKDVSAFANSDGGVLIYGVKEQGHLPKSITGIDHSKFNREFFEQVIRSNISQPSPNFIVVPIPIDEKESVYSVKIEKSYGVVHQCKEDKKFYKRHNFESLPMENYEIEDVRNRRQIAVSLINIKPVFVTHRTFLLEISNIGNDIAQDITFEIPDEIKKWVQEREIRPLRDGMRFLSPKEKITFRYAHSIEIFGMDKDHSPYFEITVNYFHSGIGQKQSDTFHIDLNSYFGSYAEKTEVFVQADKIVEELSKITREISQLNSNLSQLTQIVGASGLELSITTLRNLRQILERKDFVKINPAYLGDRVFEEILNIDNDLAYRIAWFFKNGNNANGLKAVEGITDKVIKNIEEHFILIGEVS